MIELRKFFVNGELQWVNFTESKLTGQNTLHVLSFVNLKVLLLYLFSILLGQSLVLRKVCQPVPIFFQMKNRSKINCGEQK